MAQAMGARTGARRIDTFASARVLFILACQQAHADVLEAGMGTIAATWSGQLRHQSYEVVRRVGAGGAAGRAVESLGCAPSGVLTRLSSEPLGG
jgi:hypothetical protein